MRSVDRNVFKISLISESEAVGQCSAAFLLPLRPSTAHYTHKASHNLCFQLFVKKNPEYEQILDKF